MDDARKRAYRVLLYHAMLDLRAHVPTWPGGPLRWWNPLFVRRAVTRLWYTQRVAEWLHNLAFFAAEDFRGFKEDWFWREYDGLRSKVPGERVDFYRSVFDNAASDTGGSRGGDRRTT
jgi:hypothetical protein